MEERAAYFEALCGRVAGGGDAAAQKELVTLRETGNPELCLAVARAVLDKPAAAPFAQFEALSVLEQAVLRSPTHALPVLRYLLARAGARAAREQRAVTRKHLFVAAAIYKRCFQATRVETPSEVDCSPSEFRESVWGVLRAWLGEQQPWDTRLLGIELLRNVFSNFVISCSRSLGLTIDYHYRCHCAFEELYLRQVYLAAKALIEQAVAAGGDSPPPAVRAALRTALEIVVDLLQWNWNATVSLSTYIWAAVRSLNERTSVSASEEWAAVLRGPYLFDMFGSLFRRFRRTDEEVGRLALRGLEQMASFLVHDKIQGTVAPRAPQTFIEHLLAAVGQLLACVCEGPAGGGATPGELLMVSGILSRMAANQHVKLLMFLPSWYTFLQAFGNFTELAAARLLGLLAGGAARRSDEEVEEVENSPQMAALSNALHAWSIFGKYAVYRTGTDTVQVGDCLVVLSCPFCSISSLEKRADHPDVSGPEMAALKESLGLVYQLYVRTRLQCAAAELALTGHLVSRQLPRPRASESDGGGGGGAAEEGGGLVDEEVADQLGDAALCGRAQLRVAVPLLGARIRDGIAALAAQVRAFKQGVSFFSVDRSETLRRRGEWGSRGGWRRWRSCTGCCCWRAICWRTRASGSTTAAFRALCRSTRRRAEARWCSSFGRPFRCSTGRRSATSLAAPISSRRCSRPRCSGSATASFAPTFFGSSGRRTAWRRLTRAWTTRPTPL